MERENDYSYTPIDKRLAELQTRLDKDYNESQDALFLNSCEGLDNTLSKKVCRLITDCAVPDIQVRIEDNPYGSTMPPSHPPEDIPVRLLAELLPCCHEGRTICPEFEIEEPNSIKPIDSMFMSKEVDIDLGKLKIGIDFDTEQECCDPERSDYDYIRLKPSMDCDFECTMEPIEFEHKKMFVTISGKVPTGITPRYAYMYINNGVTFKYTLITGNRISWTVTETKDEYDYIVGRLQLPDNTEFLSTGEIHYAVGYNMYRASAVVEKVTEFYIDIGYTRVYYDINTRGVIDICSREVDIEVEIPHTEECIVDEGIYQHETKDTITVASGDITVKLNEDKRVDWCEPNVDISRDRLTVTLNPRPVEHYNYVTNASFGSHGCLTQLNMSNDITVDWAKGRLKCNPVLNATNICNSVQSPRAKAKDQIWFGCGNPVLPVNHNNLAGMNGTLFTVEASMAPELQPSGVINPHLKLNIGAVRSNTIKTVGIITDIRLAGDSLLVSGGTMVFTDGLYCDTINPHQVSIPIGDILMQAVSCEKLKHCHFCECSDSSSSSSCNCAMIEIGKLPDGAEVVSVGVEIDNQYTIINDIIAVIEGPSRFSPGEIDTFVQFNKCDAGTMKETGQVTYRLNGQELLVTGNMFDNCEDIEPDASDSSSISISTSSSSSQSVDSGTYYE